LVALGLWITHSPFGPRAESLSISATSSSNTDSPTEQLDVGLASLSAAPAEATFEQSVADQPIEAIQIPLVKPTDAFAAVRPSVDAAPSDEASPTSSTPADLGKTLASSGGLEGRSPDARARLASEGGGTR